MQLGDLPRQLLAVLHADIAAYAATIEKNELLGHTAASNAVERLEEAVQKHGGKVVHFAGDAILATFTSALDAVNGAIDGQRNVAFLHRQSPDLPQMYFRIGLSIGDVILDRNDVFGVAVNTAARLQSLAVPGGICITEGVHDQVGDKVDAEFVDLGDRWLKNMSRPVHIFGISADGVEATLPSHLASTTTEERPTIIISTPSHDPTDLELGELARDLASEILAKLASLPDVSVVSETELHQRDSATNKPHPVGGPRYGLSSRLRKRGARVRTSTRVIDQTTGQLYWADVTDCEVAEPDSAMDRHVNAIVEVVAGLATKPGNTQRLVRGIGIVREIRLRQLRVRLEHEPIAGYMEAMTMDYPVHSSQLLDAVSVGEPVTFTVNTRDRVIVDIARLSHQGRE